MEADYHYTPRMYRRIVFAAAGASFEEASQSLAELSELSLLPKRVWRAAKRIGEERVNECRAAAMEYEQLPLPARQQSPVPQVPQVACVQMDGGRFQQRSRGAAKARTRECVTADSSASATASGTASGREGFWREYKAGVLMSMVSQRHVDDPCPDLPATFADPGKMREIARQIKGFTHDAPVSIEAVSIEAVSIEAASIKAASIAAEDAAAPDFKERAGRPEPLVRSVVATSGDVEAFGPLLASAAYQRGFNAAARKAFVADGSATNWGVWRRYFSHYTPILDFVHALMYVYAAAMTGRAAEDGWSHYRDWAQWLWSGKIELLLTALRARLQELGVPPANETGTPRAQVATSLNYLANHQERMKYDQYRREGLPITSSPVESVIKQINRRIKGTEKFWDDGADPMLHLVADRLSQTNVTPQFWSRRLDRLIQDARFRLAT